MDKKELYNLLEKREKEVEIRRNKRAIITTIAFSVVYFLVFYFSDVPSTLKEIVFTVFAAIFVGALHVVVNAGIFGALAQKSQDENKTIDAIKRRISELE